MSFQHKKLYELVESAQSDPVFKELQEMFQDHSYRNFSIY